MNRKMSPDVKKIEFENSKLFPFIISEIENGHTVTLQLKGVSMRPFLENDRDVAMLTKPGQARVGDPVLAEIRPGHYVLHRIREINGEDLVLMGDGNLGCENCKVSDIRASVIAFYRKGSKKMDRIDGWKWRTYSWIWTRLPIYPVRRYLLAFYRRIWFKIFK